MQVNPILLDIPHQFESSRLILRTPLDGDSNITFPAIQESIGILQSWLPKGQIPSSAEDTEELLREIRTEMLMRRVIHLLIFRQDTGDFVGETRLHRIDWSIPSASLGFWVRASMQGEGYMSEAVNRVIDISFDLFNMVRVQLLIDTENSATQRVAEKVGFTLEGTFRNHHRRNNGELTNAMVYSIIPSDRGNQTT